MRKHKTKREVRVNRELRRHGTPNAGHGWAAKQAGKIHARGRRISKRRLRKRGLL